MSWKNRASLTACLLLTACIISPKDYPLEDSAASGAGPGKGGTNGASGQGGKAGSGGAGGTSKGGSSSGSGGMAGSTGGSIDAGAGSPEVAGADVGGAGGLPEGCGLLIDDLEDGDNDVCVGDGRDGHWFVWNNKGTTQPTGTVVLPAVIAPARGQSQHGMHFTGNATTAAGVGVTLADGPVEAVSYDASQYTGIEFYARATTLLGVGVVIQTGATETVAHAGNCVSGCVGNSFPMSFPTTWTPIRIAFTQFTGGSTLFDPRDIRSIHFTTGGTFDLWVDDVSFY